MSWVLVVDEKQKGDPGGRRAAGLGKPFILPTFLNILKNKEIFILLPEFFHFTVLIRH